MPRPTSETFVTNEPLSPPPRRFSDQAGGMVEFYGVVRAREGVNAIKGIDYQTHIEMARHQLRILAAEACTLFDIHEVVVHHRTGFVPVAEPSLFLRVCAPHRHPAFEAAEWLIVQLKLRVPIWKHPIDEGTASTSC